MGSVGRSKLILFGGVWVLPMVPVVSCQSSSVPLIGPLGKWSAQTASSNVYSRVGHTRTGGTHTTGVVVRSLLLLRNLNQPSEKLSVDIDDVYLLF